jgi:hypothetical protein
VHRLGFDGRVLSGDRLEGIRGVGLVNDFIPSACIQLLHFLDEVFLGHASSNTTNGKSNLLIIVFILLLLLLSDTLPPGPITALTEPRPARFELRFA